MAKLDFNKSTFSMMIRIGNDPRLGKITELLPPSYSIIYEVAKLDDKTLEAARNDGTLHPNVTRKQIQDLRKRLVGGAGGGPAQEGNADGQEDTNSDADKEFGNLSARWNKYVIPLFDKASKKARDRFVKMVLAANKRIDKKDN